MGLVVFSDVPYELLPPGTPPSELKPLIRMLTPTTQGDVVTPWSDVFRSGTAISKALQLAQDMLEGDNVKNGTILLISDLETSPDDVPATARVLRSIKQAGTPVQLLALGPSSDARALFGGILGPDAFTPFVEHPDETQDPPPPVRRSLPVLLLALGALFLSRSRCTSATRAASRCPSSGRWRRRREVARPAPELLLVLAVAAFVAAAFLVAVAVDVDRWRTTISEDDVRYRVFSADDLWSPDTVAPLGAGRRLLGVEDDVAFRQALARCGRASSTTPPSPIRTSP